MANVLNTAEQHLFDCAREGNPCDLTGKPNVIRADVFAAMVLRQDPPNAAWRWEIKGAHFEGRVDLKDALLPDGKPVRALEFRNCTFSAGFDGSSGQFGRLVFDTCKFPWSADKYTARTAAEDDSSAPIRLSYACIDGELTFSNISKQGLLWIRARGLRCKTLTIRNLLLQSPSAQTVNPDLYTPYAIDLPGCEVAGQLLFKDVLAGGGIRLSDSRVGADLWMLGVTATDGEDEASRNRIMELNETVRPAFFAQSLTVGGNLGLYYVGSEENCTFDGHLVLRGARIGRGLVLSAVRFERPHEAVMLLNAMDIGGSVLIEATQSSAGRKWTSLPRGVYFSSTKIAGDVQIEAEAGDLLFESAEIEDDLSIAGRFRSLSARNFRVGGDCRLSAGVTRTDWRYPQQWSDYEIDLGRGHVGGVLDICQLTFDPGLPTGSLLLRGIVVDHTLWVQRYPPAFVRASVVEGLKCDPSKSLVQLTVEASRNSDVEAGAWKTSGGTYSQAVVLFLVDNSDGEAALIAGDNYLIWEAIDCDLEDEDAVKDFLRLYFAAKFDAETGGFALVEDESIEIAPEDPATGPARYVTPLQRLDTGSLCLHFGGYLQHGAILQEVKLTTHADQGWYPPVSMEMLGNPIESHSLTARTSRYSPPYRYGDQIGTADYPPLNDESVCRQITSQDEFEKLVPNWKQLLYPSDRFANVQIDLRGASCVALQDAGGQAWENAILRLGNFSYERIAAADVDEPLLDAGKGEAGLRLRWLRSQKGEDRRNPQPFAQLASVLRAQGDEDGAREIEKARMRLQSRDRIYRSWKRTTWFKPPFQSAMGYVPFWKRVSAWIAAIVIFLFAPFAWLFQVCWNFVYGQFFGYGLGIFRAMASLLLFWGLGWGAVHSLNYHHHAFVMTKTAVAPMDIDDIQATDPKGNPIANISGTRLSAVAEDADHADQTDVPCGRSINTFLYAVETFTPFLNLHQESRCELRHPAPGDRFFTWQRTLEVARFVYIVLGYIMTSLALLTFSGMARRWDQN